MTLNSATQLEPSEPQNESRDIRKTAIDPNFWYPIARSSEVKSGKVIASSFAGHPIALVRTRSGELFALENRCAHRQIPLHHGVVNQNTIKCAYHGWEYRADGQCVSVPYIDVCKKTPNSVRSYPSREAYGLIFVFPGDPALSVSQPFPEVPSANDSRYKIRYLDRRVDCHYSFMHENLMDMNHQFLHRRLMGGIKTSFLGTRQGETWIEADYTFTRATGKQPLGELLMLGKRPKIKTGDKDLMTIRTDYPYQTLKFWTAGSTHPALDLWNVYIPLDDKQSTNRTFGLMMIRRPRIPGVIELFWPFITWFTNGIFAEDRWICELEQAAFAEQGADRNQEIFPAIKLLRKILVDNGQPTPGLAD